MPLRNWSTNFFQRGRTGRLGQPVRAVALGARRTTSAALRPCGGVDVERAASARGQRRRSSDVQRRCRIGALERLAGVTVGVAR